MSTLVCPGKNGKITDVDDCEVYSPDDKKHVELTKKICSGGGTTSSTGTSTTSVQSTTSEAATQTTDTILEDVGITDNKDKQGVLALFEGIPDNTEIIDEKGVEKLLKDKNIPKILEKMDVTEKVNLLKALRKSLQNATSLQPTATTTTGTTDNSMKIAALKELEWAAFAELMKEKKIFEGEESEWKIKKDEWGEGKKDEVQKKRAKLLTNASIGTIQGGRRRRRGGTKRRRKKKSKRKKTKRRKKARKSKRRKSRKKRSKRRRTRRRR